VNAGLLIDLFEDKISGTEVVDYLLSMGTSGGFYNRTLRDVLDHKFELKKVSITDLRRSDPKFNEWLEKQNLAPFSDDAYQSNDLRSTEQDGQSLAPKARPDAPIIVINGKLRDGWHRVAGKFSRGEQFVNAYVAIGKD